LQILSTGSIRLPKNKQTTWHPSIYSLLPKYVQILCFILIFCCFNEKLKAKNEKRKMKNEKRKRKNQKRKTKNEKGKTKNEKTCWLLICFQELVCDDTRASMLVADGGSIRMAVCGSTKVVVKYFVHTIPELFFKELTIISYSPHLYLSLSHHGLISDWWGIQNLWRQLVGTVMNSTQSFSSSF
jgi:hypothetical protein